LSLFKNILAICKTCQSLFEKSFQQSARPTLRYISPEFGCRSSLLRPYPGKGFRKLWRTSCRKPFFNMLWKKRGKVRNGSIF